MVEPLHLDRISYYLAHFGVDFEVLIDDVQTAIDNEEQGEWSEAKQMLDSQKCFECFRYESSSG